jgi:hypothetical protein
MVSVLWYFSEASRTSLTSLLIYQKLLLILIISQEDTIIREDHLLTRCLPHLCAVIMTLYLAHIGYINTHSSWYGAILASIVVFFFVADALLCLPGVVWRIPSVYLGALLQALRDENLEEEGTNGQACEVKKAEVKKPKKGPSTRRRG